MSKRSNPAYARGRRVPRSLFAAASLAGALALATAASLSAPDSWIVPDAFALGTDGRLDVRGQTSVTMVFQAAGGDAGNTVPAGGGGVTQAPNDSAAVVATMQRFHAALAAGDSAAALALLAPDVVILESGGAETRDEYRAHHLPADIAFARAVKSERGAMRVAVRGDVAWVTGTSTTQGEYRGRQVNSAGAELAVLARTPEGWRIVALHWSSRTRRPPGG